MRILVTGAGGFIGGAAARALSADGHELLHVPHALMSEPARLEACLARARPEAALHLAWFSGPGILLDVDGNRRALQASLNLIAALRKTGCPRLVATGSCVAAIPESAAGRTPYAAAKRALRSALADADGAGMSTLCAQVFAVTGPGESPARIVPRIARALLSGDSLDLSAGDQRRDVLHVDDVAAALIRLLTAPVSGEVDVCRGTSSPLRELFAALEQAAGVAGVLRYGAAALPQEELYDVVGDATTLHAMGWAPRYSLEATAADVVAWWRMQP